MTSTLGRSNTNSTERSYLSIREVLELLIGDFPDVTISKIRFLEARGLIHPERTPSGYRKFYREDVERLRWILRQQRENYLPLNVIKVRLDGGQALGETDSEAASLFDDAPFEPPPSPTSEALRTPSNTESVTAAPTIRRGHPAEGIRRIGLHSAAPVRLHPQADDFDDDDDDELNEPTGVTPQVEVAAAPVVPPVPQAPSISQAPAAHESVAATVPAEQPKAAPARRRRPSRSAADGYSAEELGAAIKVPTEFIAEIANYGLIAGHDVSGVCCYDEQARSIAEIAYEFAAFGIEPRHLKSLQHAAIRESELFSQVVVPLLRQRNPEARETAQANLAELVNLGGALKSAFIQLELRNLTGG